MLNMERGGGISKHALTIPVGMFMALAEAETASVLTTLIRDAGRTQISAGTETVLTVGPDTVTRIENLTGHLKLL